MGILAILGIVIFGGLVYAFSPYRRKTTQGHEIEDFLPDSRIPVQINAPEEKEPETVPVPSPIVESHTEPPVASVPVPENLLWDTQKRAFHSARVVMDETGLTGVTDKATGHSAKDLLCACIFQESRFRPSAIGKPNSNGTIDYGLCQYNNGKLNGVPLWIGPGAAFASIQEVLTNPEKNVRIMVKTYKQGHLDWWASYKFGDYKPWLLPSSPMWELRS